MRPKWVLPLWVRVDLGVMLMKEYSIFPKTSELEPHHQVVSCHNQDTCWSVGGSYHPAEKQSFAPSDWAVNIQVKYVKQKNISLMQGCVGIIILKISVNMFGKLVKSER